MLQDISCEVEGKEDVGSFWGKITEYVQPSGVADKAYFLVSLFTNILNSLPKFLYFRPGSRGGKLTALFPFEFSQWDIREGSLLLRLWCLEQITHVWMMIIDSPPAENPVYREVARRDCSHDAYLAVLPELYSEMPLVCKETMAFAPWIRILIDSSLSFVTREEQLANYIQFAAQYNAKLPRFKGTETIKNQLRDFVIFGYLPRERAKYGKAFLDAELLSGSRAYLKIVKNAGIMSASFGGAQNILPEIPEGEDSQEYAIVCALAGQVFARLKSDWEIVAQEPYLLTTLEDVTLDKFLASVENIDYLRQIFAMFHYSPPDPDLL